MNILIVYYSLEGNTKWAVQYAAKKLGADTLSLVPKKSYPDKGFKKFLWGGKSAVMKELPELEPYSAEIEKYDTIIFATPVWASTCAPPLRTFISEQKQRLTADKKYAFIACSSGGNAVKTFASLKELLGIDDTAAELSLIDPAAKPSADNEKALEGFCEKIIK